MSGETRMIRCPRCHREALRAAPFCAGCGAPLVLGEEAVGPLDTTVDLQQGPAADPPSPLQTDVDLDRRARAAPARPAGSGGASPPGATPPPLPRRAPPAGAAAGDRGELAALERSHWDLGRPAETPAAARPALSDEAPPSRPASAGEEGRAGRGARPGRREVHVVRAEPWRRAAAWALDGLPFAAGGFVLARSLVGETALGPVPGVDELLDLLARERVIVLSIAAAVALALAVYATVAHALAGATLGKRLLRLRVVGPDGGRPSPARSAARSALALVSAGLVGLGFVLALFTRSGRGLHDLIARTWVVKAP